MSTHLHQRFIDSISEPLNADQRQCLKAMCQYLGRSNLWPVRWQTGQGGLELYFANEAERFAISLNELQSIWARLKSGQALDWDTLRRIR